MIQKTSPKLTEMMNKAIAAELRTIIQYRRHRVIVKGLSASPLSEVFEKASMDEMRHAGKIAERLNNFDISPTIKPNPISVGSAEAMLRTDAEKEAIRLYKSIIKQAVTESDEATGPLFEKILAFEEGHHDTLTLLRR